MIEFLNMIGADWSLVIVELVGIFFSSFILWRVTKTIPERKEKEDQKAKILAGLSALEKTRRTLLLFKREYIRPRAQDAARLVSYINNFSRVEDHINKIQWNLHSPNVPKLIELTELIKNDQTLKPKSNKITRTAIDKVTTKLFALSEEQIQKLLNWVFWNPDLIHKSTNTSYSLKAILTEDLSEQLYFISNYNPGILIGIEQVTENLLQLNFMIQKWHELLSVHYGLSSPSIQDMVHHIMDFLKFSASLYEAGVEITLEAIKISMDQLVEYARTRYKDHQSFELAGKSDLEALMPEPCKQSKNAKENLDSMRIKR